MNVQATLAAAISMAFISGQIVPLSDQNLVLNWDFEEFSLCPDSVNQISFCANWFQPNLFGSSTDYFNSCFPDTPVWYAVGMPNNWAGFQQARSGSGYAGAIMLGASIPNNNYREYVEGTLSESLVTGARYYMEFYVSLGNESRYAIDRIGAHFSESKLEYNDPVFQPIPVSPQVSNQVGNIITDTVNWVLISGSFIATGWERYFTIGNFYSTAETAIDTVAGTQYSFYYIEDVSVWLCDTVQQSVESYLHLPNAFSPNGDGVNDVFTVAGSSVTDFRMQVFNRWGQLVYETNDISQGWDGTYQGEAQPIGVYTVIARGQTADNKTLADSGSVTLLR